MRIATSWLSFDDVTADGRLLTAAGLALPASVWLLGLLAPPKGGLTLSYLLSYSALIVLLVFVDRTLPPASAPVGKRLVWVVTELILSLLIVGVLGNLSRSALIYLLPASRALLLFEGRPGLALSLLVWPLFSLDVLASIGLDHSGELPNYLTLMLAPYIVAVVFTRATLRQAGDRQRLQALYDQLQQAHTELQALNAKVRETAVTQERNRLAREIHDSIAHYLTVINLQLEAAEKLGSDQRERAAEQVQRARRLTLECLREVRRSVAALRTASLEELALPRALDKLVTEFVESTGLPVQLDVKVPESLQFSPEASLALYRVAQEGLTNVQRHARATAVSVVLSTQNGDVALVVQDDGVGLTNGNALDHGGFGLIGLRERVELLGGHLLFEPTDGAGCRLAVTVPLKEHA